MDTEETLSELSLYLLQAVVVNKKKAGSHDAIPPLPVSVKKEPTIKD